MYLGIKGVVLQLILALELPGVSLFHGQSFLAAWRGGKASRCPYPWVVKWQGRGLWCHSDKSPAGLRSEPSSCLQVMHFPSPRGGSLINLGKSPPGLAKDQTFYGFLFRHPSLSLSLTAVKDNLLCICEGTIQFNESPWKAARLVIRL